MPRGSAPGERRGGRGKGTPNKTTQVRRLMADVLATPEGQELLTQALAAHQQAPRGTKKALEMLREMAMLSGTLVALNQPKREADGTVRVPNDERLQNYLTIAIRAFAELARYESPTFKAIALADLTPASPVPGNDNGGSTIDHARLSELSADEFAREYAAKVAASGGG